MKITKILVFLTLVMAGCKSLDSDPQSLREYHSLDYNSPAKITGTLSEELTVSLKGLTDTRCPKDVICIQPGWVELSLLVRNSADSVSVKAVFHGNKENDKPVVFELGGRNYSLSVFKVLPVPLEGKRMEIKDYHISITIVAL